MHVSAAGNAEAFLFLSVARGKGLPQGRPCGRQGPGPAFPKPVAGEVVGGMPWGPWWWLGGA